MNQRKKQICYFGCLQKPPPRPPPKKKIRCPQKGYDYFCHPNFSSFSIWKTNSGFIFYADTFWPPSMYSPNANVLQSCPTFLHCRLFPPSPLPLSLSLLIPVCVCVCVCVCALISMENLKLACWGLLRGNTKLAKQLCCSPVILAWKWEWGVV